MTYVIHVCPKCGFYDADPILRRKDGIPCFRCGMAGKDAVDLSRINPAAHAHRRKQAFDEAATPMIRTLVERKAVRNIA